VDYIGSTSVHRQSFWPDAKPYEVRLRVAGKVPTRELAELIGEEVEALYTNGPAGGGGARKYVNELIGIVSTLIPRNKVTTHVTVLE
jgi:hypothetical protein